MNQLKNLFHLLLVALILFSCNTPKNKINAFLNLNYANPEILEFYEDYANIIESEDYSNKFKIRLIWALQNLDSCSSHSIDFDRKDTFAKAYNRIHSDSVKIEEDYKKFMKIQYFNVKKYYRVKFRTHRNLSTVMHERFFYIREYEGNKTEILSRAVGWDEFLYEEGCTEMLNNYRKRYREFLEIASKRF